MNLFDGFFERIEFNSILKLHISTFYSYEKQKLTSVKEISISDVCIFVLLPFLISSFFYYCGLTFTKDYVSILLTCLSIFAGFLFGLLAMVYSMMQENQKVDIKSIQPELIKNETAKNDLTEFLFINICFSNLLAIFSCIAIMATQFYPSKIIILLRDWKYYCELKTTYIFGTNFCSFFLIAEFTLTLLLIMRRFTILFTYQSGKRM